MPEESSAELVKVVRWPDGLVLDYEDFVREGGWEGFSHRSDDYEIVEILVSEFEKL